MNLIQPSEHLQHKAGTLPSTLPFRRLVNPGHTLIFQQGLSNSSSEYTNAAEKWGSAFKAASGPHTCTTSLKMTQISGKYFDICVRVHLCVLRQRCHGRKPVFWLLYNLECCYDTKRHWSEPDRRLANSLNATVLQDLDAGVSLLLSLHANGFANYLQNYIEAS